MKAMPRGSDAVVIDLEDAVSRSRKADARKVTGQFLETVERQELGPSLWVRINAAYRSGDSLDEDLKAALRPSLDGLVLPKLNSTADVEALAAALASYPRESMPALIGMVETAAGVQNISQLAQTGLLSGILMGEQDLSADLGLALDFDGSLLEPLRLQAVVACAAAGLPGPIGSPQLIIHDAEELRRSSRRLGALGFSGRAVIHPEQIAVVNESFLPSSDEVQQARKMVDEFQAFDESGRGVHADQQDRMIDVAVVRRARRTLARADRPARHE